MSEVTEYVANALLRVTGQAGFLLRRIFIKGIARKHPVHGANPPGEILPDWVDGDEIKALLDRGLIAQRDSSVS